MTSFLFTHQLMQMSLCVLLFLFVLTTFSSALPTSVDKSREDVEDTEEKVEFIRKVLTQLLNERQLGYTSDKRSLDMGFSRGFSGSQAARHLIGLAAANYAGGPGKRRRRETAEDLH